MGREPKRIGERMALRVAFEWLGACSGCEMAFLNIGEELVDLLQAEIDIVHAPLLMDGKYNDPWSDREGVELPVADLGFVSGSVADQDHLEILFEMRRQCEVLVATGTCATHGGIPALMNTMDRREGLEQIFQTSSTDAGHSLPDIEVPAPLDRVYACDEKVEVDLLLPGCAPNPVHLLETIRAVREGERPELPTRSVCDTCPVERRGKGEVRSIRRFLGNADYRPGQPVDSMRCLLEQGLLCLGPVTRAGCARKGVPSCIHARVPCRGCYGPVRDGGNQMLDMMNAIASNNMDFKSVDDRRSILRFSGAHGRLRPRRKR